MKRALTDLEEIEGFEYFPTHDKDLDREILLRASDKSIISTCNADRYFRDIVCDDNFFRRRLEKEYSDTLKYFNTEEYTEDDEIEIPKYKSFKDYYLHIIYYISFMKENYGYSYIGGNPRVQFEIFKQSGRDNKKLLNESSLHGELNLVKEAVKRGADIHAGHETALRMARTFGHHPEIVDYLISLGANIRNIRTVGQGRRNIHH